MRRKKTDRTFRLKRRQLSLAAGPDDLVYLGDGGTRPGRVWVMARDAFTEAVRAKRIAARTWTVVVSRSDCLVKTVSLPAETFDQARAMLEFEVAALVPLPSEQLCYDFLPLPGEKENESNCLVFLAPRERIELAATPLRDAGVEPDRIIPSSLALLAWWHAQASASTSPRMPETALLVAIDDGRAEVLSWRDGYLATARQGSIDPNCDIQLSRLLPELARDGRVTNHSGDGSPVTDVFLAGNTDRAKVLHDRIATADDSGVGVQTHLLTADVAVERLDLPHEPQAGTLSVLCVVGANLPMAATERFNLLPSDWSRVRDRRRRWTEGLKTAAAAACPFFVLYASLLVAIQRLENECTTIVRRIEPIRTVATELESKKRQSRIIHMQLSDRALPLAVLAELYRCVPDNVHLSHLSMDLDSAGPVLKMRGPAGSLDAAFAFPIVLEASPLFSDVRPEAAQQVTRGEGVLVEFGCQCRVNVDNVPRGMVAAETLTERR